MKKDKAWRGIDPWDGTCYRVRVWVKGHEYVERFRDPETTTDTMQAWRRHTRADAERGKLPAPDPGTFQADAEAYLASVTAMPTYSERERDIALWCAEFGPRPRTTIQPHEIRAVLNRWLAEGPRAVQQWVLDPVTGRKHQTFELVAGPLSASTVNHRKYALSHLWTVLDGRTARNPAREIPDFDEDPGEPRGIPAAILDAILAALPDRGQAVKGKTWLDASKARARLHVMARLGLPPAQLELLQWEDVDVEGKTCYIQRRRKGRGVQGARRPITSLGVEALKMMQAAGAWGPFDRGVVRRAWRRACAEVQKQLAATGATIDDLSRLVPYDLRHAFAASTLAATGSVDALQALLGHGDRRTSLRYARSQIPAWLAEAAARLEAAQNGTPEEKPKKAKGKADRRQNRTSRQKSREPKR
jgi:integrase